MRAGSLGSACNDWVPSTMSTVLKQTSGSYRASKTPNFAKRKKAGELLVPGYYRREDLTGSGSARYAFTTDQVGTCLGYQGLITGLGFVPSREFLTSEIEAFKSFNGQVLLREALADCLAQFDALTTLAEAHKTIDMVENVAQRAKALLRQARKGGYQTAKAAGNAWLEWRYGWRLLGYDIVSAVEAYQNPIRGITITGKSKDSFIDSYTLRKLRSDFGGIWQGLGLIFDQTVDINLQMKARVDARFSASSLNVLVSPVTTMWEVIPFSFVFDWFVDVGTALNAWQVKTSSSYVASLSTAYAEKHHTLVTGGFGWSILHDLACSGTGDLSYTRKERFPVSDISTAPTWNTKLTSKRILDAAALCIGVRKH